MATEALISFTVERIGDKLIQDAKLVTRVRGQLKQLQEDLRAMKCFLEEAAKKQEEDERVRNWVFEIGEAVYDAEDIIDMFILKAESLRTKCFATRIFKSLLNRREAGNRIEAIQISLQNISKRRETLGIKNIGEGTSRSAQMLRDLRRSSPHTQEDFIVGLTKEAYELEEQLTTGDKRRRVISIVGMPGIGKTTLAKKVYNRTEVVKHFPACRAWVYVSQDCRPRDIYWQILNQVSALSKEEAEKMEKFTENHLGDFLHNHLKDKKYLVVLDDVWACKDWDSLAKVSSGDPDSPGNVFPDGNNGSRLLLTTRDERVAHNADARGVVHKMKTLSESDSWELFRRKAFLDADSESYLPEMEQLAQEMVGKCDGLPLAIVVLGGLLSRNMSYREWEKVRNNIGAYLSKQDQKGIMAMLNLSYTDLPYYLKPCFLYLSLFPEDYVIPTRKLLFLWAAEGIVTEQDRETMKGMAEDYLNELAHRNLIQVVRMSVNGKLMECRVHDLIREFAIKKAKKENFIASNVDSQFPSANSSHSSIKSRRISIYSDFERYASTEHSTPYLRSLLFFKLDDGTQGMRQLDFIAQCFKLLRVLDLEGLVIENLPESIGKLIHLRYLGLKHTGVKILPPSIGNLRSLQTLDANNLKQVPNEIWKIKNLRYLYIEGQVDDVPLRIETLQNLQILSGIRFSQWIRNDARKLPCLGKLKVEGRFEIEEVGLSKSIAELQSLKSLYLKVSEESNLPSFDMNSCHHLSKLDMKGHLQKLFESREFPPSLTQLTLEASKLDYDPMPVLGQLPQLLTLRLRADSYLGSEMQVPANGFPQLKRLELSQLEQLKTLNIGKGALRWLRHLEFFINLDISGYDDLLKLVEVDMKGTVFFVMFSYEHVKSLQNTFDISWRLSKLENTIECRYKKGQKLTTESLQALFKEFKVAVEAAREARVAREAAREEAREAVFAAAAASEEYATDEAREALEVILELCEAFTALEAHNPNIII